MSGNLSWVSQTLMWNSLHHTHKKKNSEECLTTYRSWFVCLVKLLLLQAGFPLQSQIDTLTGLSSNVLMELACTFRSRGVILVQTKTLCLYHHSSLSVFHLIIWFIYIWNTHCHALFPHHACPTSLCSVFDQCWAAELLMSIHFAATKQSDVIHYQSIRSGISKKMQISSDAMWTNGSEDRYSEHDTVRWNSWEETNNTNLATSNDLFCNSLYSH